MSLLDNMVQRGPYIPNRQHREQLRQQRKRKEAELHEEMEVEAAQQREIQEEEDRVRDRAELLHVALPEDMQTDDMMPFCVSIVRMIEGDF